VSAHPASGSFCVPQVKLTVPSVPATVAAGLCADRVPPPALR
jgi:hypothetical protein